MSIRRAAFAGKFYPSNPADLRMGIASAFREAGKVLVDGNGQPEVNKPAYAPAPEQFFPFKPAPATPWSLTNPLLIMLPHAGHVYCGKVIAATLRNVNLPKRLIILGPKHTQPGHALALWKDGAWDIPTGRIPVDSVLAQELLDEDGGFAADTKAHAKEHDIEVLLPFLQTMRPDMHILPIVLNRTHNLDIAAKALASVVGRHQHDGDNSVAIILSSDMNHYQSVGETRRKDFMALDQVLRLDPEGLLRVVQENNISMCGVLPALLAMMACKELKAAHSRLMAYDTSGSAFGESEQVVGYAGLRIW